MARTDLPAPVYAAAGATELAYRKLRRLPEVAARTLRIATDTADELRERLGGETRELAGDWRTRVRESAERGTATLMAKAAVAQERAAAGYQRLVARGERLITERATLDGWAAATAPPEVEVEVGPVQPARPAGTGPAAAGPEPAEPAGPAADAEPARQA